MIKIVVSDLDGTLLNSRKEAPEKLESVIRELKNRGILFCAASGRSMKSVRSYFKDMPVAIIANNGGVTYSTEGNLLFAEDFPYEKAEPVIKAAHAVPYMHMVLSGVEDTYVQQDETEEHKAFANFFFNNVIKIVPDINEMFLTDRIVKMSISTGEHRRNEKRGMEFMRRFENDFSLVLSGDGWVDLTNKNVSKGSALKKLCKYYGISMEETLVFGDYLNDLDMLMLSPNSYAMANAHPDVRKNCKYVTNYTNDECGVVEELVSIFGLPTAGKK